MTRTLLVLLVITTSLLGGCAKRAVPPPALPPPDVSGFLDDYALLRPGGLGEVDRVYRNPDVDWSRYHAVLLEPVSLWRSGRKSLDPVPADDLRRLIGDFQAAVQHRLGEGFRLVKAAAPGVMRVRLAITDARASDPILDVMTDDASDHAGGKDGPLDPETRKLLANATIEGEIRDAETGTLLAAGVDRRRPEVKPFETWSELDRALEFWADRVCARLEARTGAH